MVPDGNPIKNPGIFLFKQQDFKRYQNQWVCTQAATSISLPSSDPKWQNSTSLPSSKILLSQHLGSKNFYWVCSCRLFPDRNQISTPFCFDRRSSSSLYSVPTCVVRPVMDPVEPPPGKEKDNPAVSAGRRQKSSNSHGGSLSTSLSWSTGTDPKTFLHSLFQYVLTFRNWNFWSTVHALHIYLSFDHTCIQPWMFCFQGFWWFESEIHQCRSA